VLLVSLDPSILGGAFLVMERLAGQPLLDARWLGVVPVLVEMQLRLHGLDAEVLLQALDREGRADSRTGGPPISREVVTFEGHLARLEQRVARASPHGLEKAVAWLAEHRPTVERRRVICHGDFHPQNLLVAHGRVTGVLDWPNVIVTDAEFDVASTLVILGLVPLALLGVPGHCADRPRLLDASSLLATSGVISAGDRWKPHGSHTTKPWLACAG
jgi:aminoglycoside phosphotransferase (APT) family kinase protein